MAPIVHEIDPNADTIITLKNPSTSFAIWREEYDSIPMELAPANGSEVAPEPEPEAAEVVDYPSEAAEEAEYPPESELDPVEENNFETSSEPVQEGADMSEKGSPTMETAALAEREENEHEVICFRVSSRHLMLASPWFQRALTSWSESGRHEKDGLFHIAADDWDADAFLLLLNMMHLRNRKVPRTVSLDMLAKIAVLVDYYECAEAIEVFTALWIDHLSMSNEVTSKKKKHKKVDSTLQRSIPVPSEYCRDLFLWMLVAWVFDAHDSFEQATIVAIKKCPETLHTLDLPIPPKVTDAIITRRHVIIESVISQLHNLLDKYRSKDYQCPYESVNSFTCSSFLLGGLIKQLDTMELFSPRPKAPFAGLNFDDLCGKLVAMESPTWNSNNNYYNEEHRCDLSHIVRDLVKQVTSAINGLDLIYTKYGGL